MTKKRSKKKSKKAYSGGHDIMWEIIALGSVLLVFMYIMFQFQPTIDAIPLFHILMTLGGLETYADTVIGTTILFFIGGFAMIVLD